MSFDVRRQAAQATEAVLVIFDLNGGSDSIGEIKSADVIEPTAF